MALADLSFKLYTDVGLTSPFSGTYQLTHSTTLSDNPQDFVLYFGSNATDTQLQAVSGPGVDDIVLTPTDIVSNWTASTAYTLGQVREPSTPNGRVYQVTVAGTSSGTEPTWPTSGIGSTVTDGSVTWRYLGPRHEITEITLGLTEGDLDTNTPGAPLALGPTILSGVANAVEVHIRIDNAVTNVRNTVGHPEIGIFINEVIETGV